MGINSIQLTEEEILNNYISGMNDSIIAIQTGINNDASPENIAYINRNIQHLQFMLEKNYIIEHPCDKTPFIDAITTGQEYIQNN